MRQLRVAAVAGLLVVTAALPAYAADDRPDKIGRKELPTTAQVAEHYPDLVGGERFVTRGGRSVLLRSGEDCVGTQEVARADRGTRADFFTADGLDPFEQGIDDPSVQGWRFTSVARAREVMTAVEEYAARCAGTHTDAEGHTATVTRLEDPGHGDASIALGIGVTWPAGGGGTGGYESLDLLVRDGRSIVRVLLKREDAVPSLEPALALSRVAWRRIR